MVIIGKESMLTPVFDTIGATNTVAAYRTSKAKSGTFSDGKLKIEYVPCAIMPDEDSITSVKSGEIKMKRLIKEAVKMVCKPSNDAEDSSMAIGVITIINMILHGQRSKKKPITVCFVLDEEDDERNKIITKYLCAVFGLFGIEPITKGKVVKKIFKAKKRKGKKACKTVLKNIRKYVNDKKNHQILSSKGVALKKQIQVFYELELRESIMSNMKLNDLNAESAATHIKSLLRVFTATNLKYVSSKKIAKKLAKKDRKAVKAYNQLRKILKTMDVKGMKLPKAAYGQKKKKGKAVGEKMNSKKFANFFMKKKNRALLMMVYGHILTTTLGAELGSKEYLDHMKSVNAIYEDGFAQQFAQAVKAYVKGTEPKIQ